MGAARRGPGRVPTVATFLLLYSAFASSQALATDSSPRAAHVHRAKGSTAHARRRPDSHCFPNCHWVCNEPSCPAKCEPHCLKPKCEHMCRPLGDPQCNIRCERPECEVRCVKKKCANGRCPRCENVCLPAKCQTVCEPPRPECKPQCTRPSCTWLCKKPLSCPKPKCMLKCELPNRPEVSMSGDASESSSSSSLPPSGSGASAGEGGAKSKRGGVTRGGCPSTSLGTGGKVGGKQCCPCDNPANMAAAIEIANSVTNVTHYPGKEGLPSLLELQDEYNFHKRSHPRRRSHPHLQCCPCAEYYFGGPVDGSDRRSGGEKIV